MFGVNYVIVLSTLIDVPQEIAFPIPLEYIDVIRQTTTTLDVVARESNK